MSAVIHHRMTPLGFALITDFEVLVIGSTWVFDNDDGCALGNRLPVSHGPSPCPPPGCRPPPLPAPRHTRSRLPRIESLSLLCLRAALHITRVPHRLPISGPTVSWLFPGPALVP
ncbi:hypothetical protein L6452_32635 [Arctium lappa]|uniref:Uncharacterized protein n=1 Tax=Arctium lappa TaxID=4217 RepID=A0ACB8Z480_ARCLA|nr:hypothetical protein L6452_32635 [Arctium lappa]